MMDTCEGLIVDIHDQLIIHEFHCVWIPHILAETDGETRLCTEEMFGIHTLARGCVSNGQWHPPAFALHISGTRRKVSEGLRIIEIHEALSSDLSIEQRGAVRDGG